MRTARSRCAKSPGASPGSVMPMVSDCLKSSATPPDGRPEGSMTAGPKTARQPLLSHHSCASPQASREVRWCSWIIRTWAPANSTGSPSSCHLSLKGCQAFMFSVMRPNLPLREPRPARSVVRCREVCAGCDALMGWGGASRERSAPPLVGGGCSGVPSSSVGRLSMLPSTVSPRRAAL